MAIATPDVLKHAEAFAARLLGDTHAAATGADPAGFDSRACEDWLRSTPPGIAVTPRGAALWVGSVRAFVALGERLASRHSTKCFDPTVLQVLEPGAAPAAWSGYVPVGGGWISIAIATREERERVAHCLASMGIAAHELDSLADVDIGPDELAAVLQEWGIASFPACTASCVQPEATTLRMSMPELLGAVGLPAGRPLAGVRVLDCGHLVAAPWASALLASLGARVTAVAHPVRRAARRYGPEPRALDLQSADDRRTFAHLCGTVDVVIDNFRPRVWGNLGLDPVELGAARHLCLPAFPATSAESNRKSYGFQLEAFFGVGELPAPPVPGAIRASARALLDHAVGFAAAVTAAIAIVDGREGRMELSHVAVLETLGQCAA